jgi:hypothetical protein
VNRHHVWLKTLNLALMGGTPQHILLFLCVFIFIFIFIFIFFVLLLLSVFCFSGTSVLAFKFGGNALSQTYSGQFHPSPG